MGRNNSKTNKKRSLLSLPVLKPSTAKLIIFLLLFANIGMGYLVSTKAATYKVRFVLFCAKDQSVKDLKCDGQGLATTTILSQAKEIQSWYKAKTGKSLNLHGDVKAIHATQSRSYYKNDSGRIRDDIKGRKDQFGSYYVDSYTKLVVVTGFQVFTTACGWGGAGAAVYDPLSPTSVCAHKHQEIMAHELGHEFGLGHVDNTENLMKGSSPCRSTGFTNCPLVSSHKTKLLSLPWFGSSTSSNPPASNPQPSSCPYRKGDTTGKHSDIKRSGSVDKNCLSHLQYIIDLVGKYNDNSVQSAVSYTSSLDSTTIKAVENYQSGKGIKESSGVLVGSSTWSALHSSCKTINDKPRKGPSGAYYKCVT